jgi:hypothetical protein
MIELMDKRVFHKLLHEAIHRQSFGCHAEKFVIERRERHRQGDRERHTESLMMSLCFDLSEWGLHFHKTTHYFFLQIRNEYLINIVPWAARLYRRVQAQQEKDEAKHRLGAETLHLSFPRKLEKCLRHGSIKYKPTISRPNKLKKKIKFRIWKV